MLVTVVGWLAAAGLAVKTWRELADYVLPRSAAARRAWQWCWGVGEQLSARWSR